MKKILAAFAALSALAIAAPAMADQPQYGGGSRHDDNYHQDDGYRGGDLNSDRGGDRDYGRGGDHGDFRGGMNWNFDERLDRIEWRLRDASRNGALNRYEARRFWGELRDIRLMKRDFEYSRGISPREASILDARIDRFRTALRAELHEDRYGAGYGRGW